MRSLGAPLVALAPAVVVIARAIAKFIKKILYSVSVYYPLR